MTILNLKTSLRTKFIIVFLAMILILTVLTGYLSYNRAVEALEDELGRSLMAIAQTGALMIDGDKHSTLKSPEDEESSAYKDLKKVLEDIKEVNGATYVYTMSVTDDNKVIFVVDAEVGEDMSHIGDEYEIGLEPEMEIALSGEGTFTKELYTDEWGTFKTGYAPVRNSEGETVAILGVDLSAEKVLAVEKELRTTYYYSGVIGIILGIVFSVLFAGYLTSPMRKMVKTMAAIADMKGDLTQEIKVGSRDEIGELAAQFNRMLANLRGLLMQVRSAINQVAETSSGLSDTATRARNATEEMVSAMAGTVSAVEEGSAMQRDSVRSAAEVMDQFNLSLQQVATGAVEQAKHVNKASGYVNEIAGEIQQVAESSVTVADSSAKTTDAARAGQEVITSTVEGMGKIREKAEEAANTIQELGNRSQQIGKIVQVIDNIAAQTNLLALNAAIEAARAGDHGKGFAVVADEVAKLADLSSKSTKEIGNLVVDITQGIERSVSAMSIVTSEVNEGFNKANDADRALREILELANRANIQIQQINQSTATMSEKSVGMVDVIGTVASIVEENSAASGEMAGNSTEVKKMVENIGFVSSQSAQAISDVAHSGEAMRNVVEEIADTSKLLAEMSEQLEKVTAQFKLE